MFRIRTYKSIVIIVLSAVLLLSVAGNAQSKSPARDVNTVISGAREQVLKILQNQNACAAWFQETDPDAADIFESLQYELDGRGTSEVIRLFDDVGQIRFKHPWGASTFEYGGKASVVILNSNGPFFKRDARLRTISAIGISDANVNWHVQMVGPYPGNTPEVRALILLHELGHVIGRLPADDASWNGDSARNSAEVLRHCKQAIHLLRQKETCARE